MMANADSSPCHSSTMGVNPTAAPGIWWTNAIFFLSIHVAAIYGVYLYPMHKVHWGSVFLGFATWQLADFGITIGYHRLWSHRAFRANLAVRTVLAALGSAGFQGSIKWWCLRHRLHHRFTDDPVHDPYAATRGLLYSHVGWIFFKPSYKKMDLVDRDDLESDPVVRFQHKHYLPLALFFGFVFPPVLGKLWGDPKGSFVWAGLVSRLFIWHCTFLVNSQVDFPFGMPIHIFTSSLAHWDGLQPYSDENTSRGNLLLALLTGGEGNHNFHHAFPHDFRSGPHPGDYDPSKWIIYALSKFGLATGLRRARPSDMKEALGYMQEKRLHGHSHKQTEVNWEGPVWNISKVQKFLGENPGRCVVLINDLVVDATGYMREHPGGSSIMRKYSFRLSINEDATTNTSWKDATWAFDGGLNNHSRAAKRQLSELVIAQFSDSSTLD